MTINNKTKVQQLTKATILGKTSVISYEDLEETWIKHAEKKAAKDKRNAGRKHKDITSEMNAMVSKIAQKNKAESAAMLTAPWKIPVAQMQ